MKLYSELILHLQHRLQGPLPGLEAQLSLTSRPIQERTQPPRSDHRKGGVLALLYPVEEVPHMVFMQRTEDGRVHSGQISFPGGKVETFDPHPTATALREAEEELGIPQDRVEVLGSLTPLYIPPSNFLVYPTVGYMDHRTSFVPSEKEVARIIEVPLPLLLQPDTLQETKIRIRQGLVIKAPAFMAEGNVIWGATAMMLNELLTVIREIS